MLLQGHKIDAACLQNSAFIGQVDAVHVHARLLQHLGHGPVLARQEARAQAVGILRKAQVEARRLHLPCLQRQVAADRPFGDQRLDFMVGQNARFLHHHLHPLCSQA